MEGELLQQLKFTTAGVDAVDPIFFICNERRVYMCSLACVWVVPAFGLWRRRGETGGGGGGGGGYGFRLSLLAGATQVLARITIEDCELFRPFFGIKMHTASQKYTSKMNSMHWMEQSLLKI
jgi:hypothetical protein